MATKNYNSKYNKETLYFLFNTSFILVRKKIKTLNDERLKDLPPPKKQCH